MDKPYLTLKCAAEGELTEKKSRFLSFAAPVATEKQAQDFISNVRSRYPDARHCVYAYTVSSSGTFSQRYSDDGEPQGTGGLPVLDVLRKKEITDAAVAVVRYFGGILLGAPGLVRAYSSSASLAVASAGIVRMTPLLPLRVKVSYQLWGKMENYIAKAEVISDPPEYADEVFVTVYLPSDRLESTKSAFADICAGKFSAEVGELRFFPVPVGESED